VVTDDAVLADPAFPGRARTVLEAGGVGLALHLRGPGTPGGPLFELARDLVPAGDAARAVVVVNDRVDVALLAGAAAVQLGARSLPVGRARPLLPAGTGIGVSTHAPGQVAAAEEDEADWAFVGTIYPTPSHPGRPGAGPDLVRRAARARRRLPLVAIGGVTPERVGELVAAGAAGVAVLGGVWRDPDPPGAVDRYRSALAEQEER
jgi:thiamine-phosphate diphosphorylase